jgi:hypothetical protein
MGSFFTAVMELGLDLLRIRVQSNPPVANKTHLKQPPSNYALTGIYFLKPSLNVGKASAPLNTKPLKLTKP